MKNYFSVLLVIVLCIGSNTVAYADVKSKLLGTWQLCDKETEEVDTNYYQASQVRYKQITSTNFIVFDANVQQKFLFGEFFGSYTIEKDVYTEFVDLAGKGKNNLLGDGHKYKFRLKGDMLYLRGINSEVDEVWKRIDEK